MSQDQWYALYRDSDKAVVEAGFVSAEDLGKAEHTVIGPFDPPVLDLGPYDDLKKQWNTETEQIEDIT